MRLSSVVCRLPFEDLSDSDDVGGRGGNGSGSGTGGFGFGSGSDGVGSSTNFSLCGQHLWF